MSLLKVLKTAMKNKEKTMKIIKKYRGKRIGR